MRVNYLDLGRALDPIWGDCYRAVRGCVERRTFLRGPSVRAFEEAFAAFVGARRCVAVGSGTAAITLALRAGGVSNGNSVYTAAFGCPATGAAIAAAGGVPRFVDASDDALAHGRAYMETPSIIEGETYPARFAVPVHLYGRLADLSVLRSEVKSGRMFVVEDCAQALGTPGAGRVGQAAAYSFYPTKNLGAWGDAGAVTTDDEALAREIRDLRHYGCVGEGHDWNIERWGWNARMDEVQAAVLLAKLPHVWAWQQQRARIAATYRLLLPPAMLGPWRGGAESNHIFPVFVQDRDAFRREMAARGVETGIHYPRTIPSVPAAGGDDSAFPMARRLAASVVSLPIWPGMREGEVRQVVGAAAEAWEVSSRKVLDAARAPA